MCERDSRYVAGIALTTIASVAVLTGLGHPRYGLGLGEAHDARVAPLDWLLIQAAAAHRLLGLTLAPIGQTVDYDYDALPRMAGWIGLSVLTGLALVAWVSRVRWPFLTFGIGWILMVVCPRLVVRTPRSYFAEHQWYLALVGCALIVGAVWSKWLERR